MRKWASIVIVLLSSGLGVLRAGAQVEGRTELERQLLAYINERMYNCCKDVVLTSQAGDTYEGFVLFTNGQRNNLKVTVHGGKIDYEFLGRSEADAESERAEPSSNVQLQVELQRLQDRVREQESEIARLKGFDNAPDMSAPGATPRQSPVYTQQTYRRIEKGMSYAQVSGILGDAGTRLSSSYFDGGVNEVWVWVNPDGSHVCVVFRDGAVLVRAQSGLESASAKTEEQREEAPCFDNWLLAAQIEGRIVPLDLSFGQWLDRAREAASKDANPPQIDIIEEDSRIVVEVSRGDAGNTAERTLLYLTWTLPEELALDAPELSTVERVCVPAGVRIGDKEDSNPMRAWEIMAAMAGLSAK